MNLCLFQGTFNPIHNAHLRAAKYVVVNNYADKVIFIPAYIPPHKNIDFSLSNHRFNMVKIAVADYPEFEISDIEYKRNDKSYTYLTICELRKIYHIDDKIKFIIGTDAFRKIETWHEADKLKELVHFLILFRDKNFNKEEFDYLKHKGYDFEFLELEFKDISSSEIRTKIKNKKLPEGYIPKKVEEYIYKHGLYSD